VNDGTSFAATVLKRTNPAIGVLLDDVAVLFLVLPGIAHIGETQPMQTENHLLGNGQLADPFVNEIERVAVAANFLFIPVARTRLAENDCCYTGLIDKHALYAIGGDGALNQSVLPQSFEDLRRLLGKKLLFPASFTQVGQIPRCR
jgi:hypothetical protein